jgi:1-acyl-sn-glycerol-3-phosphate acyltransferase
VSYGDAAWNSSRLWLAPITRTITRARAYGTERVPRDGGLVLAINHLHWIDVPLVGAVCPRNINYVAKVEAFDVPILSKVIDWHGAIAVRRGESDRDAVRLMRRAASEGRVVGLFVEGTRQRTGHPGVAQPGAAMVALQEEVPVVPVGVYGTQYWSVTDWKPCSVAFGEPTRFEGLPKGGRGYKEATAEIQRRVHALFEWLADVHARGRPRNETPPV